MKKALNIIKFRYIPILPCGGLTLYLLILAAAYVFAQLYRSPLSAILYAFVIVFGVADILLFALTIPFVKAEKSGLSDTLVRGNNGCLKIRFVNKSIIPISVAEAVFTFPSNDGTGNIKISNRVSVPSFVGSYVEIEVPFVRRGTYDLGVCEIFMYDTLRLVRVRKKLNIKAEVTILPRKYELGEIFSKEDGTEDSVSQLVEFSTIPDYGDIREYRPGDSMKRIHWKLSSKSEELLVRKYSSGSERSASVYCSVNKKALEYFSGIKKLEAEDTIIETAYSVAMNASGSGYKGKLYMGSDKELPFGNSNDDSCLTFELSSYVSDNSVPLCDAVGKEDMSCVYVAPFLFADSGAEVILALKHLTFKKLTVCIVDLSELICEQDKERYFDDLTVFLGSLNDMGLTVRLVKGGDMYVR